MKQQNADETDSGDRLGDASTTSIRPRSDAHLLHAELTRTVIGAFYSLHSQLGVGFLEAVYANGMAVLLRGAGIRVEREVPYDIDFHGHVIGRYRADLVVESKLIVEVKCVRTIDQAHVAQVYNYLRASRLRVGLLLNFGRAADVRRVVA